MKEELLTAREDYLQAGAHIGMTFKTADMKRFIYKVRPNGLAVLNIGVLDSRIRAAAKMIAKHENPLIISRKDNGQKPAEMLAKAIGAGLKMGRFMPGTLTNPSSEEFSEPDVVLLVDPVSDKQAMKEAVDMRIPIIAMCDTFNQTSYIDLIIPCNNKGKKSLSLILYLIAKQVLRERGEDVNAANLKLEDFEAE